MSVPILGRVVSVDSVTRLSISGENLFFCRWSTSNGFRAGQGEVPMDMTKDGKFERSDDWSSCAYFYLDRPENNLPQLDAAEKRMAGL